MSLNKVTVTGTYVDGEGNPLSGTLQFAPSAPLADSTDMKVVRQAQVSVTLSAQGTFSAALYATDDASLVPSGWCWTVKESISGLPAALWNFFLPASPASFTATSATPCVFTAAGTDFADGTGVVLTGGSLPAGFTASTTYYVTGASGTSFSLAATAGGSAITSTSTGSGTVTAVQQDISSLISVALGQLAYPFLEVAGGTMSGPLTLSGEPAAALQAAPKEYVDAETTRAEAAEAALSADFADAAPVLFPTGVKTASVTAAGSQFIPCNATSSFTVTLPGAPETGTTVAVKLVALTGSNQITVAASGSDVFNVSGGSATMTLTRVNQTVTVQYSSGIWYVLSADPALSLPLPVSLGGTGSSTQNFAALLTPTAVKTANYTASDGDFVACDTSGGAFTVTLPTAPANLAAVAVKMINTASQPNAVTISAAGGAVFNKAGGSTSLTLSMLGHGASLQYSSGSGIWYVLDDDLPLGQLDTRYITWFNVRAYGAAGNGTTDDTAAIQAAITAAGTAGGGTVFLPHGNYKVSSTLNFTSSGIAFVGEATEQVGSGSMINPTGLGFTLFEATASWLVMRDITVKWNTLTGASGGAAGPIGLWLNGANNTLLSNVQFIHAYNGILVEGGGCQFWNVDVELAAVADTGRYGFCICGAAGNPNSFNAYNCSANCDTSYTGDGWVQCDGFSSVVTYNCYAGSCRYGYWSTQNAGPVSSGGTTPSGAVMNLFCVEFSQTAMKLDYGNNLMINGAQFDSSQTSAGGIQIASTWSSGGLVQISNLEYGPGQGGIYCAASIALVMTNILMYACSQVPSLELTGAVQASIAGLWADPDGDAPSGSGVVQLDAGFTGHLSMSAFTLLNGQYGILVAAGATGTYTITSGNISGMSLAAVSLGAYPAGSAVVSVTGVPWSFSRFAGTFGDGSDGAVVFDGTTTNGFSSLSGSVYTLTRDFFATSVAVSSSVTVNPACFRMFCQGTFTNSGTIADNGAAATSSSGASGESSHVFQGGQGGGAGNTGAGGGGSQGTAIACGNGGNGGAGSSGTAGSGQSTRGGSGTWLLRTPDAVMSGVIWAATTTSVQALSGGCGGGGGGGDGTNHGGGGGAGGGVIAILAPTVVNSGTISAAGGAGFTAAAGNCGGGGGGGGGIIVVYSLLAWTAGTTTVAGGAAGSGVGTGAAGSAGTSGNVLNILVQ